MGKAVKFVAGLFIMGTTLWGYRFDVSHMYQLTFISNFLCGLLLLLDSIVNLMGQKALPTILYQLLLPCTNTVFFTVVFSLFGWHDFNFNGMFFFMHAINPIMFLLIYLFFTKLKLSSKKEYIKRIFIAPAMIMAYIIFDFIRFLITGELVYGLITAGKLNYISVPLIGIQIQSR